MWIYNCFKILNSCNFCIICWMLSPNKGGNSMNIYIQIFQKSLFFSFLFSNYFLKTHSFLGQIHLFFRGLAFTHNFRRSPFFYWDTLVELPLLFASRHKCSTPHQNTCFPKFHHMPKLSFSIGGLTPSHNFIIRSFFVIF